MTDPQYRTDIDALADELRRDHGARALEVAVSNVRENLQSTAWKHCALWLQVANRLTPARAQHP